MYCLEVLMCTIMYRRRCTFWLWIFFFFQAEDGIRDLVRSRGLGDVYKRQVLKRVTALPVSTTSPANSKPRTVRFGPFRPVYNLSLIHI